MGIFKGDILVEIRQKENGAAGLTGKILGAGVGAIAQAFRRGADGLLAMETPAASATS